MKSFRSRADGKADLAATNLSSSSALRARRLSNSSPCCWCSLVPSVCCSSIPCPSPSCSFAESGDAHRNESKMKGGARGSRGAIDRSMQIKEVASNTNGPRFRLSPLALYSYELCGNTRTEKFPECFFVRTRYNTYTFFTTISTQVYIYTVSTQVQEEEWMYTINTI